MKGRIGALSFYFRLLVFASNCFWRRRNFSRLLLFRRRLLFKEEKEKEGEEEGKDFKKEGGRGKEDREVEDKEGEKGETQIKKQIGER